MAVGLHRPRRYDIGDLDPRGSSPEQSRAQAWRLLERSRERFSEGSEVAGEIETFEIVRAAGVDAYDVRSEQDPDIEVTLPSNGDYRFVPGQKATVATTRAGSVIVGSPVAGERRKSEGGVSSGVRSSSPLGITRADPSTVESGAATVVTFFGYGFSSSPVDVLTAVVPDLDEPDEDLWPDDADVSIGTVSYVSATEVTATVTVASTVPDGYRISVRPTRAVS